MKAVSMFMNALNGTIQLADLPEKVEKLSLSCNQLTGSLDMDGLPATVRTLSLSQNKFTGNISLENLPKCLKQLKLSQNQLSANPTKDTSPWWVGPVPQFWGKPRTFLNPSSCFCHGADPIDGHRKVVGQDQYPALGEVRETAKLLPRGESPWWRDERRHLLILCLFSIRGMRLAHMHNAKSREHAHTCRKARAIFKLRYKKNQLSGTICLTCLPPALEVMCLYMNNFEGSLDFARLPKSIRKMDLEENRFSGTIDVGNLPESIWCLNVRHNLLSGIVRVPHGIHIRLDGNDELTVDRIEYKA